VDAQALSKSLHILAKLRITQTAENITFTAKEELRINGGTSFSILNASGITHGTGGQWEVKAATQALETGKSMAVVMPDFASGQLAPTQRQVQVQYHDNEPVQGAAFHIDYADGRSYQGQLDAQGRADLSNAPDGPGKLHWGEDQRPFAAKPGDSNPQYVEQLTHEHLQASLNKARGKA